MTNKRLPFSRRRRALTAGGAILLFAFVVAGLFWWRTRADHLPQTWRFSSDRSLDTWKAYGGSWKTVDGAVQNNSSERGAKLVALGAWKDYQFDADVEMLGAGGDAGLIVRTSGEDRGVDSYRGYYVGLRGDNTLFIGKANYSWTEYEQSHLLTPLVAHDFYHLRVVAVGCTIAGEFTNLKTGEKEGVQIQDSSSQCFTGGQIGLRSVFTGAVWRNLRVAAADATQLRVALLARNGSMLLQSPRNLRQLMNYYNTLLAVSNPTPLSNDKIAKHEMIRNLQLAPTDPRELVRIRGQINLLEPTMIVEDTTGGVIVSAPSAPPLKIGDEVEVTGFADPEPFTSHIIEGQVRLLWPAAATPPLHISADEAATGAFDGRFVELLARIDSNDGASLQLSSGDQEFRAELTAPDRPLAHIQTGSVVEIRGVCVASTQYTNSRVPFALLLRSNEDVQTISGPPWWSARNLVKGAVVLSFVALLAFVFYTRAEQWRLRAVMDERQRLAHELHDTLAQSFAGIGLQLRAMRRKLPSQLHLLAADLELTAELVRQGHLEARQSISMLRPAGPEEVELLSALLRAGQRIIPDGSITIQTLSSGEVRPISLKTLDVLFRVGQEGLANAVRHASATQITIALEYRPKTLALVIQDDGVGLRPREWETNGFGLHGIRQRVENVSGSMRVWSRTQGGTHLEVEVPMPQSRNFRLRLLMSSGVAAISRWKQ